MSFDLDIAVTAAAADVLTGRVWATSPLGIRVEELSPELLRLVASYPAEPAARAAAVALADLAPNLRAAEQVDWRRVHAGCPPVIVGDEQLSIDAGPTFGWGGHPSTRLVLDWLARTPPRGRRVVDVGCGSGVLSVAAAALGASSVLALDVDPAVVPVAAANAATNGVAALVEVTLEPLAGLDACFDVVVANLPGDEQLAVAADLARCCPRGPLCLSGFLAERAAAVVAAHPARRARSWRTLQGWTCVVLAPR